MEIKPVRLENKENVIVSLKTHKEKLL